MAPHGPCFESSNGKRGEALSLTPRAFGADCIEIKYGDAKVCGDETAQIKRHGGRRGTFVDGRRPVHDLTIDMDRADSECFGTAHQPLSSSDMVRWRCRRTHDPFVLAVSMSSSACVSGEWPRRRRRGPPLASPSVTLPRATDG